MIVNQFIAVQTEANLVYLDGGQRMIQEIITPIHRAHYNEPMASLDDHKRTTERAICRGTRSALSY